MNRTLGWTLLSVTALAGSAAAAVTAAFDWADQKEYKEYAKSAALCAAVRTAKVPDPDRPPAQIVVSLKGCDAEALYYGIGRPADPVRARQCALSQKPDSDDDDLYGGPAVLIGIYANGAGAPKNLDMAMHLACGLEGSTPAESDARVTHLATMKTEKAPKRFDICDDITSGFHAGQCAAHEAKITGLKRDAEMARLMSGWTPAERAAFVPLQAAQKAFTELRSGKEQDMTGTMRGVFYTDEMAIQADDFLLMIRQLSSARAPRYAAAQARDADADLNKAYQKALAAAPKTDDGGNVTQDNIRKTQRAWLAYRDAWIAFAKTKFPDYAPDSVNAWLTKKRSAMLRHLEF